MDKKAEASRVGLHSLAVKTRLRADFGWVLLAVCCASIAAVPQIGLVVVAGLALLYSILRWPFPALLLLILVPARQLPLGLGVSLFELALPLGAASSAVQMRQRPTRGSSAPVKLLAVIGLHCTLAVVSALWAISDPAWLRSVILLVQQGLAAYVAYCWTRGRGVASTSNWWATLGVAASAAAIAWFFLFDRNAAFNLQPPQGELSIVSQQLRLGSPFWGPSNYFASCLLLFVFVTWRTTWPLWTRFSGIGLIGVAIVLTLSRGALLSVLVALTCLIALRLRRRPTLLMLYLTASGLVMLLGARALDVLAARRQLSGNALLVDESRRVLLRKSIELANERLLGGYGYGNYTAVARDTAVSGAHNFYVQHLVELGVVGLATLFTVFILLLLFLIRGGPTALLLGASLIAVLANITVEASFEGVVFSWLFGFFLGFSLSSSAPVQLPPDDRIGKSRVPPTVSARLFPRHIPGRLMFSISR